MLRIANNELGYEETYSKNSEGKIVYYSKYGDSFNAPNNPWCSAFVMWVAKNTKINGTNLFTDVFQKENKIAYPLSATNSIYTFNTSKNLSFYYSNAYGGSYTPKKGDLIYFCDEGTWDKKIYSTMHIPTNGHVEIIQAVNGNTITTIGGNNKTEKTVTIDNTTRNIYAVTKRNYQIDNKKIMGYGSWYK